MRSLTHCLLAVAIVALAPALHAAVAVTVTDTKVTVSGLTAGGGAVLFTVSSTHFQATSRIRDLAVIVPDDNNDGIVEYTPASAISMRSIWVAIDKQNGHFGVSSGGGHDYPTRDVDPIREALKAQLDTDPVYTFVTDSDSLHIVIVRPLVGAWTLIAHDGGVGDADLTGNGEIAVDLAPARLVGPTGAPANPGPLQGGDIIVAIDPQHFDILTQTIPSSNGGAQ
jgi:hypothetical protein